MSTVSTTAKTTATNTSQFATPKPTAQTNEAAGDGFASQVKTLEAGEIYKANPALWAKSADKSPNDVYAVFTMAAGGILIAGASQICCTDANGNY